MTIADQTLETLEFPRVRAQLAAFTSFSAGRELALALTPSTSLSEVQQRQALTAEMRSALDELPDLGIGAARDVRRAARHAQRGGLLDGTTLLEVLGTVSAARRLNVLLGRLDQRFPLLRELAGSLPVLPSLEQLIERSIGDDGGVLDSASAELARLRREVRLAFSRLHERLQSMVTSSSLAGALQEPIVTVRNGRYVIPVKAGSRREVRGLVHDQSGSGATLYIEPMAVVELNNRWRELQSAEEEEVQRILALISDQVGAQAANLVRAVETLAHLDLTLAAARYATALAATRPTVVAWHPDDASSDQPVLLLTEARHPLLPAERVVPTTIRLGGPFNLLLITGPNTGGKTVALKTTGLLALMAQAGLQIPTSAPSQLPLFQHVFADIGDEQSIEQSLSTFSSHMTTIIRVLAALDAAVPAGDLAFADQHALLDYGPVPALVLFDELGAGTDPVEGAALARAIIERLLELKVLGVATTHYAELKAFAYSTPGVQNASVEFDVETLAPTYRLSIGLPGRSNALAIAARLGLEHKLVERARATIDRRDAAVEDLLAGIHRERDVTAAALQRAEELRADAERYRDRLAAEQQAFAAERAAQAQAARDALEEELREVRAQLKRLRDEFRTVNVSREWLEAAEQRMQSTAEQVKQQSARVAPPPAAPAVPTERGWQVGDACHVRSLNMRGEIVDLDPDEASATVQIGGFRVTVKLLELARVEGAAYSGGRPPVAARSVALPAAPDVSMTFDMRGWRVGEAADRLDRYLNDAYLAGLHQVRLIHGKGTGALRKIVQETLAAHPLVQKYSGGGRDGGDGVTIATLVER